VDGPLEASALVVEGGNTEGNERYRSTRRGSEGEMESEVVMVENAKQVLGARGLGKKGRLVRRGTTMIDC
jgi:hypothetical protein